MLKLYCGSGSWECKVLSLFMPNQEWTEIKSATVTCLKESLQTLAAELLEKIPFEIYRGTNSFDDDFLVLYATVSRLDYLKLKPSEKNPTYIKAFKAIASLLTELNLEKDNYIRFIAVSLKKVEEEALLSVPAPNAKLMVIQTLREAQTLINTTGPASAIDRVHTALHRYLLEVCDTKKFPHKPDDNITALYKIVREKHPSLNIEQGENEINRIVKSMSAIIDTLNPLRNNFSNAHPNPLLGEAEAILAINSTRTILNYLDSKMK